MTFGWVLMVVVVLSSCAKKEILQGQVTSGKFRNPVVIEIRGYAGEAMEPFISPDGQDLFFNNPTTATIDGDIHHARRITNEVFEYRGKMTSINSPEFEGAPSMDLNGNFYFTSLIDYRRNYLSIYRGKFHEEHILAPLPIDEHLSHLKLGMIDMDASISYDGHTLLLAIAKFSGKNYPDESNLIMAHPSNGVFRKVTNSEELLAQINSEKLEYAASLSRDGLELFFNRTDITSQPFQVNIMMATRDNPDQPFRTPIRIEAINGQLAEGPSISLDGHTLFYHQKDQGIFRIFRVGRE